MIPTILTTTFLVMLYLLPVGVAQAAERPEEIVITGKVSGPPLWQVQHGDNVLWIFGLLSPLPPGLELDTTRVDSVLAEADEILGVPDFDTGESFGPVKLFRLYRQFRQMRANDGGKTLQQILPEDLYQRLLAVKAAHGPRSDKLLKMRPLLAAELLEGAAIKSIGLDEDTGGITRQLQRVARKHDVPFTEVVYTTNMTISNMMASIDEVPFDTEVDCLRSMVDGLENELTFLSERAEAWAYGQVGELYAATAYGSARVSCFRALTSPPVLQEVGQHSRELWLSNAERALGENKSTFAMLDIRALLAEGGFLETLRDRGYDVIEP